MVRTPGYDKSGLKKGTWTPEEDKKLSEYVTKYGCWNWRQLPKYAGLARCGKSCRLRWMNYLRPNIKRGNYSKEEEDIIIKLHEKLGNRWSAIAAQLPGRTDNEVKNHWHTYLKKQVMTPNMTSHETNLGNIGSTLQTTSNETTPNDDFSQCTDSEVEEEGINMHHQDPTTHKINGTSSSNEASCSPQQPQMEFSDMSPDYNFRVEDFSETLDSFWSEPFLSESMLMLNNDFSTEGMMYPTGFLSPPPYTGVFGVEQYDEYDNLFSSF